jgi:hypothetical protein
MRGPYTLTVWSVVDSLEQAHVEIVGKFVFRQMEQSLIYLAYRRLLFPTGGAFFEMLGEPLSQTVRKLTLRIGRE